MLFANKKNISNSRWRNYVLIGILIFAIMGGIYYDYYWPKATIKIDGKILHVLVANNIKHWQKGLGDRDNLGKYDGMIFIFPETKQHVFVMRGMRFPIDIIWLKAGKIVDIAPNVAIEPGKSEVELTPYIARDVSDRVLELTAGTAQEYGFKIGDMLNVVR